MLRPDRHTNPDVCVINIASFILIQFKRRNRIGYDELLEAIIPESSNDIEENYPYALNFLYLLGKIDYDVNSDCFTINETE